MAPKSQRIMTSLREAGRRKDRRKEEEENEEDEDYSPNVGAFHNVPYPEQRLRFWTEPETELDLAQGTGSTVFRLGVDWGRICPTEPVDGLEKAVNWSVVSRYREILLLVRDRKMHVMLSLFHHSLPKWAARCGGWRGKDEDGEKTKKCIQYFVDFSLFCLREFGTLVRWWVTFNEPHVFAMLTYCAGAWPGASPDFFETVSTALPEGAYDGVMKNIQEAHNLAYDALKEEARKLNLPPLRIGVSHHVSYQRPYGILDAPLVAISAMMTRYPFIDAVCEKCDFLGINYYGQELVCGLGLKLMDGVEFSDSGRGVYPDGLYRSLIMFHERYNVEKGLELPFIITENGVADATDYIRRPYMLEHILAVRAAMNQGVPIQGYLFWTISDNWEWADGYGPKFGLCHVDRAHDLKRTKRPSYDLFTQICNSGVVTSAQRERAWKELETAAKNGLKRPFFREVSNGLMYAGGLDVPIERPLVSRDWRFGHYEVEGLQDPLSRFIRFSLKIISFGRIGRRKPKQGRRPSAKLTDLPVGAPSADDVEYALALEGQ